MGGAGGGFFRQDGGDHLSLAVEIQRPLDADQDVVGGTQLHRAAPDDAAADLFDDAAHRFDVERHRRQRFHCVSGAGRRGDRARGGFRHGQSGGRDNGHDDRRGAVAGQSADRVFVDDQRPVPGQALADGDHRARQCAGLGGVEPVAGAGSDEGRQLDVGVFACCDVPDNGMHCRFIEALAVDFGAHMAHRLQRFGVGQRDHIVFFGIEQLPGDFGEADFVCAEQLAGDDIERG